MADKPTILVVDDEAMLRSIFSEMLTSRGYHCIVAANALDALRMIEGNVFTLAMLVTDIMMPGELDGLDLARKLRERQPHVAILLITGFPQSCSAREAVARGYRILEKPFRQSTLEAAIAEGLEKQHAEEESSIVRLERARRRRQSGSGD